MSGRSRGARHRFDRASRTNWACVQPAASPDKSDAPVRSQRGTERRSPLAYDCDVPDEWIRQWGDPTLRIKALPVANSDQLLRRQVSRMQERLVQADGAGLAATQVGLLRRVFAFRIDREQPVDVLVNPRIVSHSSERALFLEGCLSFNAVTVAVQRSASVRLEGHDLDGRPRLLDLEGFGASLVQHEIDHLDGILTLDRATAEERRRAISELLAVAA